MEDALFFISRRIGVTSLLASLLICGSRRSSTYSAMSIQQRRARFVWGNKWGTLDEQTGRFKKHR
jgi:hypothetical protein